MNVESLNQKYDNSSIFYWCNACGDVNMPGDGDTLTTHSMDDLPIKARLLYQNYWSETDGASMYVVSLDGEFGIAWTALFDNECAKELFSSAKNPMLLMWGAINSCARSIPLQLPDGIKLLTGEHTDPDGHELMLFVPFKSTKWIKPIEDFFSGDNDCWSIIKRYVEGGPVDL